MTRLAALWPALLFALCAGFTGGFASAARFPHGWLGLAAVLVTALAAGGALEDPLRLGRGGRWLLAAALVTAAASAAASELPRAGRVAIVLLPAFVVLPAAVARLLRLAVARRLAVAAWGVAVAAIGGWALVEMARTDGARAAAPLGHHNLLAVCLAMSLPVAAVGWRERGARRAIAVLALVLGLGALASTRSLTGGIALAGAAWVASRRADRARDLLTGVALLGLGLAVPRLEAVLRGTDSSTSARRVYLEGAWSGALERPMLGWGPGTSPWTLSGFLRPRPGVNPPGELVGDPHTTPLALAFEVGLPALALILALAFVFARARAAAVEAADPDLALAGRAGLAAGGIALLGGAWLNVPAIPVTMLLVAGFALAGELVPPPADRRWPAVVLGLYVVVAAWVLAPAGLAQRAYERARLADDAQGRDQQLAEAVRRDPRFPLYRARAGWGERGAPGDGDGGDWQQLAEAAAAARGVAPLWLRAAALAHAAGEEGAARQAAARAMAFDPLSGAAPFLLHLARPRDVDCAARAFLAEPKLAAATSWRGREGERRLAIRRTGSWPGVAPEWRAEFVRQAASAAPADGPDVDLVTRIDGQPAVSSSLFLFRRSPWPAELARFRLDGDAARRVRVPRATELVTSSAEAFPARRCAPR